MYTNGNTHRVVHLKSIHLHVSLYVTFQFHKLFFNKKMFIISTHL